MGLSGNTLLTVPIDPDNNLYAFNFSLVGSDIVGPDENGWYTQTCDGYYNANFDGAKDFIDTAVEWNNQIDVGLGFSTRSGSTEVAEAYSVGANSVLVEWGAAVSTTISILAATSLLAFAC